MKILLTRVVPEEFIAKFKGGEFEFVAPEGKEVFSHEEIVELAKQISEE